MEVFINEVTHNIECGTTITQLLSILENIPTSGVAIAINGSVISSTLWSEHKVNDGDKITIIRAFYGG